ncbi:hypothetical protein TNIN_287941 [Trichonephila inaurata madagascariensis]|uniref:Uncharacterized protein n=1 Tax=Trichonephila inaurata madagascariensis TaxID=2747483 RepID=A0A8X7CL95_9ARAC|nr:hypothetical protein TNIN_287941 [Trichonephila inaurata madagascariensis]
MRIFYSTALPYPLSIPAERINYPKLLPIFFFLSTARPPYTADDSHKEAPPRRVETSSVAIIPSNRNGKPRFSDATCAWISQFVRNFSSALIYNRFFSYISREGGDNPLGDFRCQRRYLCGGDGECLESLH